MLHGRGAVERVLTETKTEATRAIRDCMSRHFFRSKGDFLALRGSFLELRGDFFVVVDFLEILLEGRFF